MTNASAVFAAHAAGYEGPRRFAVLAGRRAR
jgi:hypothetical protein